MKLSKKGFISAFLSVFMVLLLSGCASMQSTQSTPGSAEAAEDGLVIGDTLPSDLPIASSVEMISKAKNKANAIALFISNSEDEMESIWLCRKTGDTSEFTIVDELDLEENEMAPDCVWYSDAENGETYTYKIVYRTTEGSFVESNEMTICRLDRPTAVTEEGISQLEWEENTEADGYKVRYATESDFSDQKTIMIEGCENTSFPIDRLTPDQEYWFRVRSYKTIDGKTYYSSWSRAWSVTLIEATEVS